MIAKIIKGKSFRSLIEYVFNGNRAKVLFSNMAGRTSRELAHEFGQFRKLRPTLGKAVAHIPISIHPDDRSLTDSELADIAQRIAVGLGFGNCPRLIVKHNDTQHQHFHMLMSRIDHHGKTVPDAHDYRKAEQLLRQIERDYGLHQVDSPSASHPVKKPIKEETMETTTTAINITNPSSDPLAMVMSDPYSHAQTSSAQKRKREQKRELTEPNYEQFIRSIFGAELRSVYHHPGGTVLYFEKPKELRDEGHKLTARNMTSQEAAKKLVAVAIGRGWTSVMFTGSDEFVRIAMREAMDRGLKVLPANEMQIGLIDEIRCEVLGDSLLSASAPDPDSFLARLRKRRTDQQAPQVPQAPHTPSKPRL